MRFKWNILRKFRVWKRRNLNLAICIFTLRTIIYDAIYGFQASALLLQYFKDKEKLISQREDMILAKYSPRFMRCLDRTDSPSSSTKENLRITGFHVSLPIIPPSILFCENTYPLCVYQQTNDWYFKELPMGSFRAPGTWRTW